MGSATVARVPAKRTVDKGTWSPRGASRSGQKSSLSKQRLVGAVCDDRLHLLLTQTFNPLCLDGAEVELEAGGHGILRNACLYGHQGAQV